MRLHIDGFMGADVFRESFYARDAPGHCASIRHWASGTLVRSGRKGLGLWSGRARSDKNIWLKGEYG
jgi:hypothetical protein